MSQILEPRESEREAADCRPALLRQLELLHDWAWKAILIHIKTYGTCLARFLTGLNHCLQVNVIVILTALVPVLSCL